MVYSAAALVLIPLHRAGGAIKGDILFPRKENIPL